MRMYDLIEKKKQGKNLTKEEIEFLVDGYTKGEIPDYQMSALLMAIYFNGMDDEEMTNLTMSMAYSGDMMDLSAIEGVKSDKHSTGGVGDKTTLIVAPIVAACGIKVAKMSGRGLGHTGGTIDKLESIPGFKTTLSKEEFIENINKIGLSVIGQSGNITPADKKIYALRDVTATVDSIPLIASSIMSKKLAAGSDNILLDVKTGSGAFMTTLEGSKELAQKMVAIGNKAGRRTAALITNMDVPLGYAIGNSLEVIEAIDTLKGNGPKDLEVVCIELAAAMLYLSDKAENMENGRELARSVIDDGSALEKLSQMIGAQGGDDKVLKDYDIFKKPLYSYDVNSLNEGYICCINSQDFGKASTVLGAGRNTKDEEIDSSAGIIMKKKIGDYVEKGEVLATMYSDKMETFEVAKEIILNSYGFGNEKIEDIQLIIDFVS